MRDTGIFLTTRLLLVVAWVFGFAAWLISLVLLALHWLALQPARASVWLSRQHSLTWLEAREAERYERIEEERRRHEF